MEDTSAPLSYRSDPHCPQNLPGGLSHLSPSVALYLLTYSCLVLSLSPPGFLTPLPFIPRTLPNKSPAHISWPQVPWSASVVPSLRVHDSMNRRRRILNSEINNYLLITNHMEETSRGGPSSGMYLLKGTTSIGKELIQKMKWDGKQAGIRVTEGGINMGIRMSEAYQTSQVEVRLDLGLKGRLR